MAIQQHLAFVNTACCAVEEINHLGRYDIHSGSSYYRIGGPREAMLDFCQQVFVAKAVKFKTLNARPGKLYSFYLFGAGSRAKNEKTYATNFADFIRENKLGTLVESESVENEAYHGGRYNQAWLWTPDRVALLRWWEKNKPANEVAPTTSVVEPVVKG